MGEVVDTGALRIHGSPHGSHRSFGPARLTFDLAKANPRRGNAVHDRARRPLIAVRAEAVGAKSVDQNQNDIEILSIRQTFNLFYRTYGTRWNRDLYLGIDPNQNQYARKDKVDP